jgi:hypothetical protein
VARVAASPAGTSRHVCVDDATRLAYVEALGDERGETAVGFLGRAIEWFAARGVKVERVMTDNGSPYVSKTHARAYRALGLRHPRTRPYRPRTNGQAERFIQTLQNEWAYAATYATSVERTAQLSPWLDHHNSSRPHGTLNHQAPAAHLAQLTAQQHPQERHLDRRRRLRCATARLLILGGTLFLGRHLAQEGLTRGHDLRLWLDLPRHPELRGFMAVDVTRALAAGLAFRPLEETVRTC